MTLSGKRKRPETEMVSDSDISDTESIGSNFEAPPRKMNLGPYSPPTGIRGTGLPPPFNKKPKWPVWKDDVFVCEMYNAQHRCGVYSELAQSSNYSWQLSALWDLIAATVEQKCRSIYGGHPDVVDENTLKTSADQVRARARLYKTNAGLIEADQSCMLWSMSATLDFKIKVKCVFVYNPYSNLPPCEIPNNPKSTTGSSRGRGRSVASSSAATQVQGDVPDVPANSWSFTLESKHFRDLKSMSDAAESDLKQLCSVHNVSRAGYLKYSEYLSENTTRATKFLSKSNSEKWEHIQYVLQMEGYYQGPPVMAPPQYQYAAPPPPPPAQKQRGFLEGCLAALCCCCLLDECCCDPTLIIS